MKRKIVISALLNQVQAGIVENGRLVEYYLERDRGDRVVGNIYKGRVENILPGMGAAFVDLGLEKNGFLFLADMPEQASGDGLKIGDTLLVQVSKEAVGTKGPRVTTDIALPGRYLVLLPYQDHVGISRQISQEAERARLKEIAQEIQPQEMGLIVRTVAEGCEREELQDDLQDLLVEWATIQGKHRGKAKQGGTNSPRLVYQDYDLVHRILRDLYVPENTKITVDSAELQSRVEAELVSLGVKHLPPVEHYSGKVNLFTHLGLHKDLQRARNNRVWLDCGGYLIFNQTEALLSIDVNTGKYVGGQDLQATVLKTNLQAAEEIAHQLRLRNVGGIVIIDFIDMSKPDNREAVLEQLATSLAQDKTRTNLLGFTRLGLVELTRKKSKRLLSHLLETDCPHCQGTGRVTADETIAFQIAGEVNSLAVESEVEAILVRCHSAVAAQLIGPGGSNLDILEEQTGKSIFVRGDDALLRHSYQLVSGSVEQIQRQAYPVQVGDRLNLTILEPHEKHRGSGLARLDGFVIECLHCEHLVGQAVDLEITALHKTSALARQIIN